MAWFRKEESEIFELRVDDMRCANCEVSVKLALRKVDGVRQVKVNRIQKRVIVRVDGKSGVTFEDLVSALEQVGYPAGRFESIA